MASTLGVQRAIVVSAQDPAGKGRARLQIPQIFGSAVTDWVEPAAPGGVTPVPGSTVWVMFQGGDTSHPVYLSTPPDLSGVVHLSGAETVTGAKNFTGGLTKNGNSVVDTTDSRLTDARTPTAHAVTHQPGGTDPMAVDAVAATGSLRTLGTGAQQATAGNDSRLTNARTPTAHATTHQQGGTDPMAVDAIAATGSLRTLGTGAQQAAPGNDVRFGAIAPAGALMDYAGSAAPTGWVLCDGSAISRTTFAALFAVISTTFGVGDGSTTFNVPDFRGRMSIGAGTGSGLTARTLAATGGSENAIVVTHDHAQTGTVSSDHSHSGTTAGQNADHAHSLQLSDQFKANAVASPPVKTNAGVPGDGTYGANTDHGHNFTTGGISANHTHTVNASGVSGTGANMTPFLVVNKIIKT